MAYFQNEALHSDENQVKEQKCVDDCQTKYYLFSEDIDCFPKLKFGVLFSEDADCFPKLKVVELPPNILSTGFAALPAVPIERLPNNAVL